jgi:hypothetical protein
MSTLNSTAKWLGAAAAVSFVLFFLDFPNATIFSKEKRRVSIPVITANFEQ